MASVALLAAVTGAIELLKAHVPVLSLGVLYLFAVLPVAVVWGLAYAIPVSIASMAAFNFLFLPPLYTFTLADSRNWFALASLHAARGPDRRSLPGPTLRRLARSRHGLGPNPLAQKVVLSS